ncbi:hypothetical protein [Fibrella aquatilis]|uniref:Uncharacterized protein n=1 Tax=Fibrella aquatilis TaxID=2817059 RepID=A0A939G5E9_9BACT|nr:hypothetical protein [Fibrella aquatilis]MBO0930351.1 hypothetical protein [Fibrella aquatilis]
MSATPAAAVDARANLVVLRVGFPRTGKTVHLKRLIETAGQKKGVLIYDINNEAKYQDYPQITLAQLAKWKSTGIYRIFSDDDQAVLAAIYKYAYNCMVVFEDATAYIKPNVQDEIRKLLVSRRHRNLDLLFTFHSLNRVPKQLYEMTNLLVLGKTSDGIENGGTLQKVPNFELVKAAWQRVQAHESRYHYEVITIQ